MYCWGNNRFNQLGLVDQDSESIKFTENAHFDGDVQKVACGGRHTLFLLEDGTVLSCGQNPCGQLGRKSASTSLDPIHALEAQTIIDLSSGLNHSVAICSEGNIFTWGEGLYGQLGSGKLSHQSPVPRRITGFADIKVIQVACGHYHTLALSEDSSVYSWGKNDFGQLGLGKQISNQASPQLVKSLRGVPLVQVTAGGSHSFALSTSGNVFGWGRNNVEQLGFKSDPLKGGVYKPHAVNSLRNFNVGYISCGDEHSAVLSKDGTVYTFGNGTHGQLGKNVESYTSVPQKIEEYEGQVSQVACGSYHTLLYIFTSYTIISFGYGLQTNHDASTDKDSQQSSPLPITLDISSLISPKDLVKIHIKQIFAGNHVSFATSSLQPQNQTKTFLHDNLKKICHLKKPMVRNWVERKPGREKNQDAKREISKIFSSSACLTASFLKHRVSPSDMSPLVDLDAASDLFTKLCQVKWIADIICSCFKSDLIPSMESLPTLYEALSIFLLVPQCPIMYDTNICVPLITALANAVTNLSTNSLKILESMWSALPAPWFTKQIQMFKIALVMAVLNNNSATTIKDLLEVLKKLYKVNIKANSKVPIDFFWVPEVSNVIIVPVDLRNWQIWRKETSHEESNSPVIYCRFPFILTFPIKVHYLHVDAALKKEAIKINTNQVLMMNRMQGISDIPRIPILQLKVRREYLLEDTLHKLSIAEDGDFLKELQVEFVGESASDPRAAKLEFFLHVSEKMVHPDYGLFTCSDPMLPVWFPNHALGEKKKYYYYGILCGMAIFNQTVMYLPFPLALYKKILGKKITVEDLTELQPSMGSCLQIILHAKDADVEHLELYFSLTWEKQTIELIPNGATERVTGLNKKDYVNKCIDYIFNTSVAETFQEFERGLHKVIDKDILSFFQPNELMALVAGHGNYDWKIFEQNTMYLGNYSRGHPTIKMFWKVFHKLTQEQKKGFLYFLTGNDKIPVFGLENICIKISSFGVPKEDYLPEAHTCTQQLLLPEYSTLSLLRKKLLLAIENNKGFHKF